MKPCTRPIDQESTNAGLQARVELLEAKMAAMEAMFGPFSIPQAQPNNWTREDVPNPAARRKSKRP